MPHGRGMVKFVRNVLPRPGTLGSWEQTLKEINGWNCQFLVEISFPGLGPWPPRPWRSCEQILKEIVEGNG